MLRLASKQSLVMASKSHIKNNIRNIIALQDLGEVNPKNTKVD